MDDFFDFAKSPGLTRCVTSDSPIERSPWSDRMLGRQMGIWKVGSLPGAVMLRKPRYLIFAIGAAALLALGLFLAFDRQDSRQPMLNATEEPCTDGPGGQRVGYLKTVLLCPVESPKCKPDQIQVFRAPRSGGWNAEAMLIPDVPEGYVITGGDVMDPSIYRITNMGFNSVSVTSYTNANDYCTQHYWYYLHANWISSDPSDRVRIKICVYYDKWQGTAPAGTCSEPTLNPP
ncbi:MAG: hypothetical protein JO366_15395 [Methylobacteriaceae bacterium]|nr:hypothetical protein [Methylobacteriaceae bacterium]MBV9246187.1 hypothetical protein [Methylobacteriaceae bacterium]MBV9635809.1 hypothetical protein [Methylobacteriaceae bacterium]